MVVELGAKTEYIKLSERGLEKFKEMLKNNNRGYIILKIYAVLHVVYYSMI